MSGTVLDESYQYVFGPSSGSTGFGTALGTTVSSGSLEFVSSGGYASGGAPFKT